ncbi:MAG: 1,9-bis(guanidino)-5-aza-nonane synthase [Phycisphaerales bacterium]
MPKMTKAQLLSKPVEHIDLASFDARPIVDGYRATAFQARNLARAADIYNMMLADKDCAVILTLAGSMVSAGLKKAIVTLIENNMVDAIVSTGANIVDQDFFEGLGFRHYVAQWSPENPPVTDEELRDLSIDRIYDTLINEDELRVCDDVTREVFDSMTPGAYSSRELIDAMGAYLAEKKPDVEGVVLAAHRKRVPIFCPAFSDCSAGFGIVMHQMARLDQPHVQFDSGKDFRELTQIKLINPSTGLLMLGGGVPKNFAQDIVVAAELLGEDAPMHKYAIQLTVADSRDGALSGSTLREACSWGKVDTVHEQMVFGEATTTFPILASDALHRRKWEGRPERKFNEALASALTAKA